MALQRFHAKEVEMLHFTVCLRNEFLSEARVVLDLNPRLNPGSAIFATVRLNGRRIVVSYSPEDGGFKLQRPACLIPRGALVNPDRVIPTSREAAYAVAASFAMVTP